MRLETCQYTETAPDIARWPRENFAAFGKEPRTATIHRPGRELQGLNDEDALTGRAPGYLCLVFGDANYMSGQLPLPNGGIIANG